MFGGSYIKYCLGEGEGEGGGEGGLGDDPQEILEILGPSRLFLMVFKLFGGKLLLPQLDRTLS